MTAAMLSQESAYAFALAGNARFTLVSEATGARFTFLVRKAEKGDGRDDRDEDRWFVSVLNGPDNSNDYAYLGCIVADRITPRGRYQRGKKSKISENARSAKAFSWWWNKIASGIPAAQCEVWHLGKCGRCGRDLTVPESIDSGFGPDCLQKRVA